MQLHIRIDCDRMPREADGKPNHGNNAIELAVLLRRLANDLDRSADTITPGHRYGVATDTAIVGEAVYSMFGTFAFPL
jgi:hypothetical protein